MNNIFGQPRPKPIKIHISNIDASSSSSATPARQPLRNIINTHNQQQQPQPQLKPQPSALNRQQRVLAVASSTSIASLNASQPANQPLSMSNSPDSSKVFTYSNKNSQAFSSLTNNSVCFIQEPVQQQSSWLSKCPSFESVELACKNHENKLAKYYILSEDAEYEALEDNDGALLYCEKCAVVLASQGFRVALINTNNYNKNSQNKMSKQQNLFTRSGHTLNDQQRATTTNFSCTSLKICKPLRSNSRGIRPQLEDSHERFVDEANGLLKQLNGFLNQSFQIKDLSYEQKTNILGQYQDIIENITNSEECLVEHIRDLAKQHRQEIRKMVMDFELTFKHRIAEIEQAADAIYHIAVDIERCKPTLHKVGEKKFDEFMDQYREQLRRARNVLNDPDALSIARISFDETSINDMKGLISQCFGRCLVSKSSQQEEISLNKIPTQAPANNYLKQAQNKFKKGPSPLIIRNTVEASVNQNMEEMQQAGQEELSYNQSHNLQQPLQSERSSNNNMFFSFENDMLQHMQAKNSSPSQNNSSGNLLMSSIKKKFHNFEELKEHQVRIRVTCSDQKKQQQTQQHPANLPSEYEEESIVDEDFKAMMIKNNN